MGARRRGGQRQDQEGAGGRAGRPGRGGLHRPPPRGRACRAAPVGPPLLPAPGRFPATRLTQPSGPGAGEGAQPGRPAAEGRGGGGSEAQRQQGCPGYCGD